MSPLVGPDLCPRCGQQGVAGTPHLCLAQQARPKPARAQISLSKWSSDFLFAASELLVAVEAADQALVTDEVRAAAERLRAVVKRSDE